MEPVRDKNGLTEQEFLAAYQPKDYERPALTADIAVFSVTEEETRLLLIRRGNHPYLGKWALPGGFAEKGETIESTAGRELEEETELKGLTLVPVGLFTRPGRDPRAWVVSQAFASVIPSQRIREAHAGDDAAAVRWFAVRSERIGHTVVLTFEAEEVSFQVRLRQNTEKTGIDRIEVLESGGLAFDHAHIIGCAMLQAGLL